MFATALALTLFTTASLLAQDAGARSGTPASPTPSSQPAAEARAGEGPRTQRKPRDAEILDRLLKEQDQAPLPPPIAPVRIGAQAGKPEVLQPVASLGDGTLLLEGVAIVSRPGRLVREGDALVFVFHAGDEQSMRYAMPINPGSYLELMEREFERGATEFEVSAEVRLYKGKNYLDLRKVVRRVPNNNLAP